MSNLALYLDHQGFVGGFAKVVSDNRTVALAFRQHVTDLPKKREREALASDLALDTLEMAISSTFDSLLPPGSGIKGRLHEWRENRRSKDFAACVLKYVYANKCKPLAEREANAAAAVLGHAAEISQQDPAFSIELMEFLATPDGEPMLQGVRAFLDSGEPESSHGKAIVGEWAALVLAVEDLRWLERLFKDLEAEVGAESEQFPILPVSTEFTTGLVSEADPEAEVGDLVPLEELGINNLPWTQPPPKFGPRSEGKLKHHRPPKRSMHPKVKLSVAEIDEPLVKREQMVVEKQITTERVVKTAVRIEELAAALGDDLYGPVRIRTTSGLIASGSRPQNFGRSVHGEVDGSRGIGHGLF